MKRYLTAALACAAIFAGAQTLEETASIYKAYPTPSGVRAKAPEGYEPFYISHYGRHGSRWITDDERYLATIAPFDSAYAIGGLTTLGIDMRERLQRINDDAIGRSGSLTPIGERQHHDIASRMYEAFPQVFAYPAKVHAVSSTSMRCAMSMSAFTEALKEHNPLLLVKREPYAKHMDYIAYTSPEAKAFHNDTTWRNEYIALIRDIVKPQRLMASLFTDPSGIDPITQYKIMENLYWAASDMQDVELDENLYDIFTYDELYAIWRTINARMYVCNGNYPAANGVMLKSADSLIDDIIAKADSAIANGDVSANLRFGHDTNLLRLLARMGIKGCAEATAKLADAHTVWRDYQLSPMAANLQLVFYRNGKGNVLVRLLLNEEDAYLPIQSANAPFYNWSDVKAYWKR